MSIRKNSFEIGQHSVIVSKNYKLNNLIVHWASCHCWHGLLPEYLELLGHSCFLLFDIRGHFSPSIVLNPQPWYYRLLGIEARYITYCICVDYDLHHVTHRICLIYCSLNFQCCTSYKLMMRSTIYLLTCRDLDRVESADYTTCFIMLNAFSLLFLVIWPRADVIF